MYRLLELMVRMSWQRSVSVTAVKQTNMRYRPAELPVHRRRSRHALHTASGMDRSDGSDMAARVSKARFTAWSRRASKAWDGSDCRDSSWQTDTYTQIQTYIRLWEPNTQLYDSWQTRWPVWPLWTPHDTLHILHCRLHILHCIGLYSSRWIHKTHLVYSLLFLNLFY